MAPMATQHGSIIADLEEKVKDLNAKAKRIDKRLFVFDEFVPKHIPKGLNSEVRFWYLIINLYGLFYDCGKYIKTLRYNKSDDYHYISNFYGALNEVRSIFCHNKTSATYLNAKIANEFFDQYQQEWQMRWRDTWNDNFKYANFLDRTITDENWNALCVLFKHGYEKALCILDDWLNNLNACLTSLDDSQRDEDIFEKWANHIIEWYAKNDEANLRAICDYSEVYKNEPMVRNFFGCYQNAVNFDVGIAVRNHNDRIIRIKTEIQKCFLDKKDQDNEKKNRKEAFGYLKLQGLELTPLALFEACISCTISK